MLYRSRHFYCHNKANSDSLLMAYYIVTFLASSWLHSSVTHSSGTGVRSLSNLEIEASHRFILPSRLSLQAIIASSLVMMDNGRASIKIRPEQYLSEWKAHSRTFDSILDAPPPPSQCIHGTVAKHFSVLNLDVVVWRVFVRPPLLKISPLWALKQHQQKLCHI